MKRGRRAELLSYRSEFIQIVLQHFHSEEKGALCQDLPVHIPQIFPKNTAKKKKKKKTEEFRHKHVQLH